MTGLMIDDELMGMVSGGFNLDDLSEEDYRRLDTLGGIIMDMQIMNVKKDPAFDPEEYKRRLFEMKDLNRELQQKYG